MKKEKPLSPHLQIYRWQITNTLSILHRFTGVILFLAGIKLSVWFFLLLTNCPFYMDCMHYVLTSALGKSSIAVGITTLMYHFANGIRHLIWDMGCGYSVKKSTLSGQIVIVVTIISFFVALYILFWS